MIFYIGFLAFLLASPKIASAVTVTYNWDVTWVNVNPDDRHARPAIGINGQWPCPPITANVGDQVVINVKNKLGNETTSIHFHGLFQQGTNSMDGPVGVTQCPIPPGGSFQYAFNINQSGTYWYHSHDSGQYPDGFRGPIIVHDPTSPYIGQYDEELVLTVTDWYHDQAPYLINTYLSAAKNPDGGEPVPYSALFNEAQNIKFSISPGKTYFVRIISMAAFAATYVHFDQHEMTIIEIDGVYTEKQTANTIYVTAAQRYGVLIKAKPTASKNYAFLGSFDLNMFDSVPGYLNPNVTGYLVYDEYQPLPAEPPTLSSFNAIDDFTLVPYDQQALLGNPDQTITLNMDFTVIDGQNRAVFNNVTYVDQKVPSLMTALSVGSYATNPKVYGTGSNPSVLHYNSIVEIVVNNFDTGGHPFHLHGHQFQVAARSAVGAGTYNGDTSHFPAIPMRRDTVMTNTGGYLVLRYKADNPGVFLFHCHIEWHVAAGLSATMVEAPLELQKQQSIPAAQLQTCKSEGIPTLGNAAANTQNPLNLTGANTAPPPNPMGALV